MTHQTNFKSKERSTADKSGKQSHTNGNLSLLIESAGDGIVSISRNGIVTLWNKGAEEILGYAKNEAIGQHIGIVIPWNKKHKKQLLFDGIISRGELIKDFKTERVTKDGKKIVIMGTISPVKDHSDNVIDTSFPNIAGTFDFFNTKRGVCKVRTFKQFHFFSKGFSCFLSELSIGSVKTWRTNNLHDLSISFKKFFMFFDFRTFPLRKSFSTFFSSACHSLDQNHAWLRSIVSCGLIKIPPSVTSKSIRSPTFILAFLRISAGIVIWKFLWILEMVDIYKPPTNLQYNEIT